MLLWLTACSPTINTDYGSVDEDTDLEPTDASDSGHSDTDTGHNPDVEDTAPPPDVPFEEVPGATYLETPEGRQIALPWACKTSATPILVNRWIVYPVSKCDETADDRLLGYNLDSERVYVLNDGLWSNGTLGWTPEADVLVTAVIGSGALVYLDPVTFAPRLKVQGHTAQSDSSPLFFGDLTYFGTINSPYPTCQGTSPNDDCGAVFAAATTGAVAHRLGVDSGERFWLTASPVTDGEAIFVGGGADSYGEDATTFRYGCSVLSLSPQLELHAYDDPDDPGCHPIGNIESAVAGELALGPDSVWAQFMGPGDDREQSAVIRYNRDIEEQCRFEKTGSSSMSSANFYQAPTVDHEGNAYVVMAVPGETIPSEAQLYRVGLGCEASLLAAVPGRSGATPTLADDKYVLFATPGKLQVLTLDGEAVEEFGLATEAAVVASPMIEEDVFVLAEDGALTILTDSIVTGYGTAWWPRFRHDNRGSATLDR